MINFIPKLWFITLIEISVLKVCLLCTFQYAFEDSMNLISKLPTVAAIIYRNLYRDGKVCAIDPNADWSANFTRMLGYDNRDFTELMRLYLTIHT